MIAEWLNKLKSRAIFRILSLANTDFQESLFATIIEWSLRLLPQIRIMLIFAVHVWTVLIAYKRVGFVGATVTAISPIISETYWLIVLFFESSNLFWGFLLTLVFVGVFMYLSKLLTPIRFGFSFKLDRVLNQAR